jgi:hypothetical protein
VSDRRLAQRVPVRFSARYRSPNRTAEGVITDLSRLGLFFSGVPEESVGTPAVVDVVLPHAHLLVSGKVVRRDDGTIGIGFLFGNLADEARRLIANIVLSAHSAA